MSWKNKASFLKFGSVQHRIGGEEFTFYGLTSSTLFRFEGMAKDLALAFSALFRGSDLDFSFEERVFKDGRETIRHPAQENLVRLRAEEQAKALDRLCGAVFAKENQSLLAEVLMDSLRDVFGTDRKGWPTAGEFFAETPAEALRDMLVGVAKANKGLLGPLVGSLDSNTVQRLGKSLAGRLAAFEQAEESQTPETDGTSFDSKSSGCEAEATTSTTS